MSQATASTSVAAATSVSAAPGAPTHSAPAPALGPTPQERLRGLAVAAVIGTDRAGGLAAAPNAAGTAGASGAVRTMGNAGGIGAGSPAELLTLAAVCGARARAGAQPARVTATTSACPPDPNPVAGPGATSVLARLLAEPDAGIIEEWADLAIRRGVRVTDALAPLLLEWWSRQPRRSGAVWRALGTRGAWLASLNPQWQKLATAGGIPDDAERAWETGTLAERAAVLTAIRRVDPARGLALVRTTWDADPADARQRFIECLAEGCSMDDEPFLEDCLDDRSKTVRLAACSLLARIPTSRYRLRMTERARSIIGTAPQQVRLGTKQESLLRPPAEFDSSWRRDGIEEKPPSGHGPRLWWMVQILSLADLVVWTEAFQAPPRGVLTAIAGDIYEDKALTAMNNAAMLGRDATWCSALIDRHLAHSSKADVRAIGPLATCLEPADAEAALLEIAARDPIPWPEKWQVLVATGRPWSAAYSERALTMLKAYQPKKVETYWIYEGADRVSRLVAPAAAELFEEVVLASCTHQPSDSVKKSVARVRLRAEMHKELA